MSGARTWSFVPTPLEIGALVFAAYFFGFVAGGINGAAVGLAGASAGVVASRVVGRAAPERGLGPLAWVGAVIALAAVAPFIAAGDFRTTQMATAAYVAIGVLGLNLLTGYTGQVSIGHSAFIGIGGYTTAIVANEWGTGFFVAIAAGTLVAALAGILIGIPALRLSGPYLAIATLGLAVVFGPILKVNELAGLTGGRDGLNLFSEDFGPPVDWSWLTNARWYYFISVTSLGVAVLFARHLTDSAVGRSFRAVRDGELPAAAAGINVTFTKLTAFAISSAYAGFAGGMLFLLSNRYVSPDSFTVLIAIEYLVALVIGGMASIPGSLIGAFFLVYIYREALDDLSRRTQEGSNLPLFVAGFALAAAVIFGSTWVRQRVARYGARFGGAYGGLVLNGALALVCVALGFAFTALVRAATEGFLDLITLRGALTGMFLILTVIAMPAGVAGALSRIGDLTWRDVLSAAREQLIVPAAVGGDPGPPSAAEHEAGHEAAAEPGR